MGNARPGNCYNFGVRALLTAIFSWTLVGLTSGCSGDSVKAITSKTVSKAVEAGKGVVAGIDDGIDAGRKVGDSADGARIVSSTKDLGELVSLKIGESKIQESKALIVQIAVDNQEKQAVRLTGIKVLGLDAKGFAHPGKAAGELTVPAQSKGELLVHFEGKGLKTHKLRVWGAEIAGEVQPQVAEKTKPEGR